MRANCFVLYIKNVILKRERILQCTTPHTETGILKIYPYELKKSVVNFYKSNIWSIDNALKIFNVSRSSIYAWIQLDKDFLLLEDSNIRNNYKKNINDEAEKYIVTYVTKKVNFNKKNIKNV